MTLDPPRNARSPTATPRAAWPAAVLHGLPIALVVLALFYYWFAVADRYTTFLYYHDMGPLVPDTSPFSAATRSRYWMCGLVAGGVVTVLYAATTWLLGRLRTAYRPPAWWRVWGIAAVPVAVAVPLITMTANEPTLPAPLAAQVTVVALVGVGLAAAPDALAAERPGELVLLSLDGAAMAGLILGVSMLERVGWAMGRGLVYSILILALGVVGAAALLGGVTALRGWRHLGVPDALQMFVAGLCVAYLLTPLAHHILFTDGYYYIPTADNYFSWRWEFQILAWLAAAGVALGLTRLRRWLTARTGRGRGPSRRARRA